MEPQSNFITEDVLHFKPCENWESFIFKDGTFVYWGESIEKAEEFHKNYIKGGSVVFKTF